MNESAKDISIKHLIERIKQSDEKAFSILFDKLWEPLYVYAYSLLDNSSFAKDIVQDVWIDFWERKLEIENDNIKAYLYKAIRYKVLSELRNSKIKESHLEVFKQLQDEVYSTPNEEDSSLENPSVIIEKTLSVLPDKCQQVFKLSRLNGLKNKEIAEELGISERTVETHISKAIKLLKKGTAFLFTISYCFLNIN